MDIRHVIGIIFAIIAALLWLGSALVPIPKKVSGHVVRPRQSPLGGDPLDGTYIGQFYSEDMDSLTSSLRKQSKCSAIAAVLTALSIFCAI